ncbi:ABC transporter substrate-binding protein [Nesterenkonia lutea]|uniref:Multiple sugar transport system substrate-binding protein n=1 Tax=Nesterenkonia lutea TaxID=272919 RepID=A0ABR9JG97_9MICC|nr:ABC transporter substrate-binding protein [Nesterenkonia lutea]MBE1524957.1 multiple sugar transport system substrate-binding protein [Nesterenkonia lutea]
MNKTARGAKTVAIASLAALTISACGGGSGDDDENVNLRFTWWGGDTRHAYTQEIIDAFEEEHPDITISPEFDSWEGYWDSLATQSAARDTPDIMQMDLSYIREYIENGLLHELDQVETAAFTDQLLDTGSYEGSLYGMPVGSTSLTMMANEAVFEDAGVEMPDDDTWTWDEVAQTAAEISENSEAYGQARPFNDAGLGVWLRQHNGTNMVTEDGEVAWDPEDVVPYFEMLGESLDSGAIPSGSQVNEDRAAALEQTMIATGDAAMDVWWDTQVIVLSSNEGVQLTPLKLPSESGDAQNAQLYYKPSMFYSVYEGTEHPEEAQLFIDYLVNSEEAGQLQQLERGIPGNADVREAIRDDLDEAETTLLEYNEGLEEVVADAPPLPPEGFGAVQEIIWRYEEEFLFGRVSAEEAAQRMHDEIEGALG